MGHTVQKVLAFLAAVCLYIFLLQSIFAVYYTSPLVHGIKPIPLNVTPLATHLIVMVSDGLRADELFGYQMEHAPFLKDILLNQGAWGLSHTRVPTESRPGHIAIFGGFYEDVASVTKGWKANAVEFDSILNRSQRAWAWGTDEVVQAFSLDQSGHVVAESSPDELSDLAQHSTSDIDRWTVDKFLALLHNKTMGFLTKFPVSSQDTEALRQGHVAFLHLNGADIVGHSYHPRSPAYRELMRQLDGLVSEVVRKIKHATTGLDVRVAFILTADHGMTDWGSHGAGSLHETATPLLVWGDGLAKPKLLPEGASEVQTATTDMYGILSHMNGRQRRDIQQADLCPLMASLIGTPIPVNSVGVLPLELLDVNDSVKVKLIRANCLQLLAQVQIKREEKQRNHFTAFFKEFRSLTQQDVYTRLKKAKQLETENASSRVLEQYKQLAELALVALRYYHTYDRQFLGVCIGLTYFLWSLVIVSTSMPPQVAEMTHSRMLKLIRLLVTVVLFLWGLCVLFYVHLSPLSHTICQLVPMALALHLMWSPAVRRLPLKRFASSLFPGQFRGTSPQSDTSCSLSSFGMILLRTIICLCILELLIWCFHYRPLLSVACFLVALWPLIDNSFGSGRPVLCCLWSLNCLVLGLFPLLPVVGSFFRPMLAGVSGLAIALVCALFFSWLSTSGNTLKYQMSRTNIYLGYILCLLLALSGCAVLLERSDILLSSNVTLSIRIFSWCSLGLPLILFFGLAPRLGLRVFGWISVHTIQFILLSTGYEVIFLGVLLCFGLLWIQLEAPDLNPNQLWFIDTRNQLEEQSNHTKDPLNLRNFRQSLFFIFLLVLSFFGTGNIASVNSFDPRTTYCFITRLKPAVMAFFLMLKILAPMLCLGVIHAAVQLASCHRHPSNLGANETMQTAICVVISNFIAVHFFAWLRDEGSWLDIGTSISHYVIAMGVGLVAYLFSSLGRKALSLGFFTASVDERIGSDKHV